jgi:adenylosuccinate synthase
MFGGAYPYNTSNDTSFMGILSSLGIRPVPGRVAELLVLKAFPSAVGTHEFPERVSNVDPELLALEKQFGIDTGEL